MLLMSISFAASLVFFSQSADHCEGFACLTTALYFVVYPHIAPSAPSTQAIDDFNFDETSYIAKKTKPFISIKTQL